MRNIEDNLKIFNSFTNDEQKQFIDGYNFLIQNPSNLIFGNTYIICKKHLGGFIDLYKNENSNTGLIQFGVHPFMRGNNIASVMINDVINYSIENKINIIYLNVKKENHKCISVINHINSGKKFKEFDDYIRIQIKCYKKRIF